MCNNLRQNQETLRGSKIYLTLLITSGACAGLASILLRIAGTMVRDGSAVLSLPNGLRILAIFAYGIGFVLYAISLKRSTIATAYPVMVTTTMIVVTVFTATADKTVSARELGGIASVLFGVWLLVARQ
jgi:drug/metabolite transporter (DMT)-like permease